MIEPTPDKAKMGSTALNAAVKFAFKPRVEAQQAAEAEAASEGAPVPRASVGVRMATAAPHMMDHWVSLVVQAAFGILAIAFAIHPIKVVPPDTVRCIIAGFGVLCIPFVPDGIASGVNTLAPAAKTVAEIVKSFLPTKGG